ncbi:Holliday junction branch migration protein RuvA [Hazenella sp. IB182357]|uniref:Holliday junction branch migration complex subunit RuvA n=1 Tax=Polycladospora coralii TaxID=2771432 RepID=A0A926NE18_9BACL|nr:Holliday junction branch migration protein RuvA [Polycladospora coralii]MBD1371733.1 Holliday junction branch migration protein RuvA [Polycladospora coralii]MBS7529200.1 Holliday junction branch migration protein RuvA [Polycladospora coralii]
MIEFINGKVHYLGSDYVAVAVNGVGYQVYVANLFRFEEGSDVFLFTHQVVREDAQLLYGFITVEERDLFRLLLEVSGIGPKAAIAMLANGKPEEVVRAIQLEDLKYLTKMPGIGKKTAQRIVLDIQDKLKKRGWENRFAHDLITKSDLSRANERDVVDALIALGYTEEEASEATARVVEFIVVDSISTEEWIKLALQKSMVK